MKIYKKGNYIVFDNVGGVVKMEHANEVRVSKSSVAGDSYTFASDDIGVVNVDFADIKDVDGNAYASVTVLNDFLFENTGFNTASGGSGAVVQSGEIIAITELSNASLVTHTVPTGSNFTAINLNSDGTNRFAKISFVAPTNGSVLINMLFDMIVNNSNSVQMIGLHTDSSATTTPSSGWYRVNADNDSNSGQFYSEFILTELIAGDSYTYYFMSVSNYSGNKIRASQQQSGGYSSGSDLPAPLRISVYDLGYLEITTNPAN